MCAKNFSSAPKFTPSGKFSAADFAFWPNIFQTGQNLGETPLPPLTLPQVTTPL